MSYQLWRDRLAEALDERLFSVEYVDWLVASGRASIFQNDRAAVLVEIKGYPTGAKDVHALVAAGDLDAIVALAPAVEAWGRWLGCDGALIESRPGWERAMKKHGYSPFQVAIRKEL